MGRKVEAGWVKASKGKGNFKMSNNFTWLLIFPAKDDQYPA
jgi:hypothetical protein